MKKSFIVTSVIALVIFAAYAAFGADIKAARADEEHEGISVHVQAGATGTRVDTEGSENGEADHMGTDPESPDDLMPEQGDQDVDSTSSLETSIQDHQDELDAEASSTDDGSEQEALNDHDNTRLAVHALLSAKNLLNDIEPEVSELAEEVSGTVTSTIAAETNIASRGWFAKLFFGGDHEDAGNLLQETSHNQTDIRKLKDVIASCTNCSAQVKTLLTDRLDLALAEQTRLQALAKAEMDARGLFGSLFGWLKK